MHALVAVRNPAGEVDRNCQMARCRPLLCTSVNVARKSNAATIETAGQDETGRVTRLHPIKIKSIICGFIEYYVDKVLAFLLSSIHSRWGNKGESMKPETYTLKYEVKGESKTEEVAGLAQAEARAIEIAKTIADGFVNADDSDGESAFHIEG